MTAYFSYGGRTETVRIKPTVRESPCSLVYILALSSSFVELHCVTC
eukprot:gene25502-34055_t